METKKKMPYLSSFSFPRLHKGILAIMTTSLGIPSEHRGKHIFSRILKYLSFFTAIGLFLTNTVFAISDSVDLDTESDILDGIVSVFTVSYFCILGLYSRRLAKLKIKRLFITNHAQDTLKLDGKSFLILLILIIFYIAMNCSMINNLSPDLRMDIALDNKANISSDNPCMAVNLPGEVCQTYWIFQALYSLLFIYWNFCVAMVMVSVSRIQIRNIKRFLGELKRDALLLDRYLNLSYEENDAGNYFWMDSKTITEVFDQTVNMSEDDPIKTTTINENTKTADEVVVIKRNNYRRMSEEEENVTHVDNKMSEQEILHKYWRLAMSVRMVSISLEPWMSSVMALITAWSAVRLVYWLSHDPSLYGVCMFILPLLLLPLLASTYADVNYQGALVVQHIAPTMARADMFQYLYGIPIQMTIYGSVITFYIIGTVAAGILAAFASKILLQEFDDYNL